MSFGTAVRFEPDQDGKPFLFWEEAKARRPNRKLTYKTREQRYRLRRSHFEQYCKDYQYDVSHKHDRKGYSSVNHIKRNIDLIRQRSSRNSHSRVPKPYVNNVINRCTPRRPPNSITLTDTQLNALLDAVRSLSPDSQSTIRFKLNGKVNEIEVNSTKQLATQDESREQEQISSGDEDNTSRETILPANVESKLPLERPHGVDRSGAFDIGSLSPGHDDLEPLGEVRRLVESDSRETKKLEPLDHNKTNKITAAPSATMTMSIWSDPGSSLELPPLVPRAHLTLAEKKKPQWIRERAELESGYDPWRRPGVRKMRRPISRACSILTDFPVMEDENKVLKRIQDRTKWLIDLEKQRDENRLRKFEEHEASKKEMCNKFVENFSLDQKPVPLPNQINIQKDRSLVTRMPSRTHEPEPLYRVSPSKNYKRLLKHQQVQTKQFISEV